jgi:hypothetical protein
MALATSCPAEEYHRVVLVDEAELGQVGQHLGIDGGLEVEVELLKGLAEREMGEAQPGREPPLVSPITGNSPELITEIPHL